MFTIELLSLLQNIKQSNEPSSYYSSLAKLINENKAKFEEFKLSPEYTAEIEEIVTSALSHEEVKLEETKLNDIDDDFSKIKQAYIIWQQEYNKTNTITPRNSEIVDEIINFYAENRFDILEKILEIETDQDYELFKNHLRNKLRVYFSKQIVQYSKSEKYKALNFIKKFKKRKELFDLMNELNKYNFNSKKINEVLQ